MKKTKIIIDCDPGHDDAIAILVAGNHPSIELLALTTVAGNQTLNKTTLNALHVCEHLGLDIPVYAGMSLPLVREQVVAANVHGESGLDGPVFGPLHTKVQPQHAVNYLIDTLLASDGDITLVPIGPLTNIATAMRMEPKSCRKYIRLFSWEALTARVISHRLQNSIFSPTPRLQALYSETVLSSQ